MEQLISVIVPVYNVEEYVDTCIDSIIHQTYSNLEIILINDGSKDTSGNKCDEWAKRDDRIIVIHKKNEGLSAARNTGLEHAHGNYIVFVDSDDYIHPQMYELLVSAMEKENADAAICRTLTVKEQDVVEYQEYADYSVEKTDDRKAIQKRFMAEDTVAIARVWNKLYRKESIGTYKFPVNKIIEDIRFNVLVLSKLTKVVWIKEALYCYRQRKGSICAEKTDSFFIDYIDAMVFEYYELNQTKDEEIEAESAFYFLNKLALFETEAWMRGLQKASKYAREEFIKLFNEKKGFLTGGTNKGKIYLARYAKWLYHILKYNQIKKVNM